ncbi:MAG TPA: hypothetical protein VGQ06_02815 [Gemmatimonadales bacterium]|nr:hypothetical protein [Gemmatimonadales bacterium]
MNVLSGGPHAGRDQGSAGRIVSVQQGSAGQHTAQDAGAALLQMNATPLGVSPGPG